MNPQWIIDDSTPIQSQAVNGMGHGYVERDVDKFPVYGASPTEIKVYPRVEWPEQIKEKAAKKSRLSDLRNRGGKDGGPIPYLNQGSFPYCWKHSATHAIMLMRAKMGLPYVALSAFSLCPDVRSGGWAALAFDDAMTVGAAPQSVVPQGRDSVRTPAIIEASKPYRVAEGWWDAGTHPGLRKLTFDQAATQLLDNNPTPWELNWWGHSVLGLDLVEVDPSRDLQDPARWGVDILNSWLNWGDNGVGRLVGNRAIPDSCVTLTSLTAA